MSALIELSEPMELHPPHVPPPPPPSDPGWIIRGMITVFFIVFLFFTVTGFMEDNCVSTSCTPAKEWDNVCEVNISHTKWYVDRKCPTIGESTTCYLQWSDILNRHMAKFECQTNFSNAITRLFITLLFLSCFAPLFK